MKFQPVRHAGHAPAQRHPMGRAIKDVSRKIKDVPIKNSKLKYYATHGVQLLVPNRLYRRRLDRLLAAAGRYDPEHIRDRVDYYNRLTVPFVVDSSVPSIREFRKEDRKTYFFDLYEYLRYFDEGMRCHYLFGDVSRVPEVPTLLKSRPIHGDNARSVLMNLNKVRHFQFVKDALSFTAKKDLLVWRGGAHQPQRKDFVRRFHDHPLCDVRQTNRTERDVPWQAEKMSIRDQLKYKFVFSIEGNDVASNLKWIMSSNSLAIMPRPKFETWFMEGRLIAGHHYVEVRDDLADLEEKIVHYSRHAEEALQIIDKAHRHVHRFTDRREEDLVSLLTLKKYFELSGQL